jgi:hypothetical protein
MIKKELKESKHGGSTEQVEKLIVKKSDIKYHYTHIYHILRKWIQTESTKKSTCKHCIQRREKWFQKKVAQILVDKHIQQQEDEFTMVSLDESFFFHDSLVIRVWIEQEKRPN